MSYKAIELMAKNDNLDVVAAVLSAAYLLKTTEKLNFNDYDLYVNTYLNIKAGLINSLIGKE